MTKSVMPCAVYNFMMCHRIGCPRISTMGLGRTVVSALSLLPYPPARITAFIGPIPPSVTSTTMPSRVDDLQLGERHDQTRAQPPRAQLGRDRRTIVPGEQHHIVGLLIDQALIVDNRNVL